MSEPVREPTVFNHKYGRTNVKISKHAHKHKKYHIKVFNLKLVKNLLKTF